VLGSVLVILLLARTPLSGFLLNIALKHFSPLVNLDDIRPLRVQDPENEIHPTSQSDHNLYLHHTHSQSQRKGWILFLLGLLEASCWFSFVGYSSVHQPLPPLVFLSSAIITALGWSYFAIRPLIKPVNSLPVDLLILGIAQIVVSGFQGIVVLGDAWISDISIPWSPRLVLQSASLITSLCGIVILGSLPMNSRGGDLSLPCPTEDSLTLWDWLTFSWLPKVPVGFPDN
jgi:hypothetical protein